MKKRKKKFDPDACPRCKGTGSVGVPVRLTPFSYRLNKETCEECKGSGKHSAGPIMELAAEVIRGDDGN